MSDEKKLPDTQPTEVATSTKPLPVQKDAATEVVQPVTAADEPIVVVVEAPKKKRRRWPWVLGGILLVLAVLLTIAFFVAESYAKDYARDYIKQRIVAVLGIEDPSQVKVDIGSGSVLLQALAGKLNQIDVTADEVTFGVLKGAATVHAEGVPLDQEAPVDSLEITFAVAEDDVRVLAGNLTTIPLDSLVLEEPEIVISVTWTVPFFGTQVPIGMEIEPSADEGRIAFTPTSISALGQNYTAEELRQSFLGGLAGPLLKQQSFCVAENLPAALTIVDVDVVKKNLIVKINGDGAAFGGPDLSTPGTCAA